MILPDVNVLLMAVNAAGSEHRAARDALTEGFLDARGVGFAWVSLLAFLRLSTRAGIFATPLSTADAMRVVDHWLAQPRARILRETDRHSAVIGSLLRAAGTAGNLTTDAHLAALAIEHEATVLSFDRDFARFPGVRWRIPVGRYEGSFGVHDR